jgi:putative flavoprotein involved in K+ transport
MYRTSVVVIGAGQAGLAVSHLLSAAGTDHVVLDRGRAAARWDAHAWQSLRLLTPNWMSRLPGHRYRGPDPDGFMRAKEVGGYLRSYAALSAASVTDGRRVALAVGSHSRVPRTYRALDICWWLDALGVFDRARADHPRPAAAPREPSLQLSGRPGGCDVGLPALQARGVVLTGRLTGTDGRRARLAEDLAVTTRQADERLRKLLRRIDAFAERSGIATGTGLVEPDGAVRAHGAPTELDLLRAGYRSVIWATGYRRSYPWLHVPVLDGGGDIRHRNGSTTSPGLHVVGMRWQTRRSSTFLDGVRHDATIVVARVLADLDGRRATAGSAA